MFNLTCPCCSMSFPYMGYHNFYLMAITPTMTTNLHKAKWLPAHRSISTRRRVKQSVSPKTDSLMMFIRYFGKPPKSQFGKNRRNAGENRRNAGENRFIFFSHFPLCCLNFYMLHKASTVGTTAAHCGGNLRRSLLRK